MRAKKSLGQNFLTSRGVAQDIITAAHITSGDTVLEIGPGKGFLTEGLLQKAGKVIAVEKDNRMIEYLKDKFANEIASGKLELIHEDILSLQREVSVIRRILSEEGKLTDWAKKALSKAREESESEYVDIEDV